MIEDTTDAGYKAAKAGKPNQPNLRMFSEGWDCYHDLEFWSARAEVLGLKVYGWSYRNSCSFYGDDTKTIIEWSDTLELIHDKIKENT